MAASIALAAGALLVPACGGGGDEGLSREELTGRADAICEEYDQRAEDIEEPQGLDDVERYVGETRTLIRDGLDDLKELEPPEEIAADYEAWIAQSEENLGLLDDLEAAAAAEDPARCSRFSPRLRKPARGRTAGPRSWASRSVVRTTDEFAAAPQRVSRSCCGPRPASGR